MKRAAQVEIDASIMDEAESAGLDLSAELERVLRRKLQRRATPEEIAQWQAENRHVFEERNRYLEEEGTLADRIAGRK